MKKITISITAIIAITAVPWKAVFPGKTMAMMDRIPNGQIIAIEGEVQIARSGGRQFPATAGTPIYFGDRFLTAASSQVVLQCNNLAILQAGAEDKNLCPFAQPTAECDPEAYECPKRGNDIALLEKIPYVISPRRTALLDSRPKLRWHPVAEASRYTATLLKNGAEEVWSEKDTTETEINYPSDRPALEPGAEYILIVETDTEAFSLDAPTLPGGVGFRLLDGEKAEKVRAAKAEIEKQDLDETAKALAIAFLYKENGLTAEAIALLESLAATATNPAPIHLQLGNLYWDYLSLAIEASEHYQQAAALAEPERVELLAEAKYKLGQFEEERGNIDKAIEFFSAARESYNVLGDLLRARELELKLNELRGDG